MPFRAPRFLIVGVCVAVTLATCALIGKESLTHAAEERAHQVVDGLRIHDQSIDTAAMRLTAQVHSRYATSNLGSRSWLWRLRHYLTHDLIPATFRLPKGVIEVLVPGGECDSNARRLMYVLETAGVRSSQLNIVTRFGSGHSVVLAHLSDEREVMLDPHFGIVPQLDGELLSPSRAFEAHNTGADIWRKLAPTSEDWFYEDFFDQAVFAAQGSPLEIRAEVKLTDNRPLVLGQRNGDSGDVGHAGSAYGLTAYWTYLGRRYDRGFTRTLRFAQDTRVEIGLTGPVDLGFITTSTMPRIEGDALVWDVVADDSLTFVDRWAKRNWFRLRSYQPIDYVRFSEPVPQH